jgi:hypothetical protein
MDHLLFLSGETIASLQIYVLDDKMNQTPVGVKANCISEAWVWHADI